MTIHAQYDNRKCNKGKEWDGYEAKVFEVFGGAGYPSRTRGEGIRNDFVIEEAMI